MTIRTGAPIPAGLPTTAAPQDIPETDPEASGATDGGGEQTSRTAEADSESVDTGPILLKERVRDVLPSLPGPGLTAAGGTLLGLGFVGFGAALDIALGQGLGLGFHVTFVVTCVIVALTLRARALAAAVVLPPLLYAGAALLQTWSGGQTTGNRAAALDVATTLALSAPPLFLGTAAAAAIALVRLVAHVARR